ncbi:MAG TPA: lipopolysaccharide biosynthesis protein [Conexibacter sp.]|nr:lipopolysaccharide biosynthesis protein [Conexibacter sp.]
MSYRQGAALGVLSFGAMGVVSLISSVVVARLYGVEEIGRWALASAPASAAAFLSSFRERPAVVRELALLPPRAPRVTALVAAVFAASTALTLVVGALGFVVAAALYRGPLHHPDLVRATGVAMAGYVLVTNSCFNLDTVLAAFRAARALFWIRLGQGLAFLACAVAFGLASPSAMSLVLAGIVSYALSLVHRIVALRPLMRLRIARAELRDGFAALPGIVRFGLKIVPGGICDGTANQAPTWILAATGSLAQVGAFNRAASLQNRFTDLSYRLNEMLFPTLVERRARHDHEGFDRALLDSLRYAAGGMLLPAAAVGGAAPGVMALFGPGFGRAAGALAVLCAVPAAATLSNMQRHALYAVERPWLGSAGAALRLAVTLGATLALTRWLGLTGTALGVAAGFAVDLTFSWTMTRRQLALPVRRLLSWRLRLAVPIAYAAGFGAARATWLALPLPGALPLALAAGLAAYGAAFALAGGLAPRDRERARAGLAALRRRLGAGAVEVHAPVTRSTPQDA